MKNRFITGSIQKKVGIIPQVSTRLSYHDYLGTVMVRWSINRNHYKVNPGLYAVGTPDELSDVFVTANYKLSFDTLRKNLDGLNAWILVLDTKGINVWCAAGKGTFGTKELVNRIKLTSLEKIITHRKLIVPQLGATGISAHEVKSMTDSPDKRMVQTSDNISPDIGTFMKEDFQVRSNPGFTVIYGPVRAADIKNFINAGYKATREMRRVTFTFTDRLKLIPVDFMNGKFYLLAALALLLALSCLNRSGISFRQVTHEGLSAMLNVFLAYVAGIVITPMILPYMPFRSFAAKGFISGLVLSVILLLLGMMGNNYPEIISWFLIITAISSFLAMNFTGSSTFTSLSGVKKEMKFAVPFQISFSAVGLVLSIVGKLL